jgi:hypothetical protein
MFVNRSETDKSGGNGEVSSFKLASVMHTGRHVMCNETNPFQLPYDVWWQKQHNAVNSIIL